MKKIDWKDGAKGGTPIPWEVHDYITELFYKGIIPRVLIDAKFMNTYHPELLYEEMLNGKEKSYEELKEYFKDLWKNE